MPDPDRLGLGDPEQIGAYRLVGVLGSGGQGTVYLGWAPSGRQVAVKVLHARLAAEADVRDRFEREADLARRVAAFCTAQVLETGVGDGRLYMVSEYVPGPSLERLIAEEGTRSGSALERLAVTTVTALEALHRTGIVHRDFKPANVIMGPEGPVVIDFGLARIMEASASGSYPVGTVGYIAPEQLAGQRGGPPSDTFAWGATMIYAVTGHVAFPGPHPAAVMHAVLNDEPDLNGVPDELRPLLLACLAKDPAARPTSTQILAALTGRDGVRAPDGPGSDGHARHDPVPSDRHGSSTADRPGSGTAADLTVDTLGPGHAPSRQGRDTDLSRQRRQVGVLAAGSLGFAFLQVLVIYTTAFDEISESGLLMLAPLWIFLVAFGGSGLLMRRPTPIKMGAVGSAATALMYVLYLALWPLL